MAETFKYITVTIILVLFLAVSLLFNVYQYNNKDYKKDVTDSPIIDTIRYEYPVPKDSLIVKYIIDTLPIYDTTKIIDSVSVQIPIEQKVYSDTNFIAYVSGYKPTIDSIFVFQKKEKRKRWGVGLQLGYGMSREMKPSAYIGIGISYNLFNF
jgi:hypothetical protein